MEDNAKESVKHLTRPLHHDNLVKLCDKKKTKGVGEMEEKQAQTILEINNTLKSIDSRLERIDSQTRLDTKIAFYFSIFFIAFFIGQLFISVGGCE